MVGGSKGKKKRRKIEGCRRRKRRKFSLQPSEATQQLQQQQQQQQQQRVLRKRKSNCEIHPYPACAVQLEKVIDRKERLKEEEEIDGGTAPLRRAERGKLAAKKN